MERSEAIQKLRLLAGKEFHDLAKEYDITVTSPSGKANKGWAGNVLERYLGLQLNSAQSPNFGSWELKCIPLKILSSGELAFKETMAITMIDSHNVINKSFSESHLLSKLRKAVVVTRTVGKHYLEPSFLHSVFELELSGELYDMVEKDYEEIRQCICDPNRGFDALTGRMGHFIQPRTKGRGHGSKSRAFYARTIFLRQFITL